MIIRRRRTKNFTILENEVVEDERLALDEIGLLTWLRSRPDHWEVSRAYIAKRFKIGRDKVARIFRSLIECGWMVREITPPGVPARYVVCDEPGAEVEMTADDLAEIEGPQRAENPSTTETVADLSQSGFPSTGNSSAGDPPTENPATIVRTDLKQELKPPQPPQGGASSEDDPEFEKDWQGFKASYPDGMTDPDAAKRELAKLIPLERKRCIEALPIYADRLRRRREKAMKAHLFVRKRSWEGLMAAPGANSDAPQLIEPASNTGRAILALAKIARYRPLQLRDGRITFRGKVDAQLLAMADLAEAPTQIHKFGSSGFGAWNRFIRKVFPNCNLPALTEIEAPGPWPPKTDGTIYSGPDPPPSDRVDGTLATEADLEVMAKG